MENEGNKRSWKKKATRALEKIPRPTSKTEKLPDSTSQVISIKQNVIKNETNENFELLFLVNRRGSRFMGQTQSTQISFLQVG